MKNALGFFLGLDRPTDTSPLHRKRPLRRLSTLVNTLETSVKCIANPFRRHDENEKDDRENESSMNEVDTSIDTLETLDNDNTLDDMENVENMNDMENDAALPTLQRVDPIRRTQSLYTNPAQLRGNGHLSNTDIRTFKVSQDLIPRIDEAQMARILAGEHAGQFDEYVVVDCRFQYEYDGGHIAAAINVPLQSELENTFFAHAARFRRDRTRLLIFHCEYSVFRGPTMASHLRKIDRVYNADNYPDLLYPDMVVLDGGYKRFFDTHKHHCHPQAYVEMRDLNHRSTCESLMNKVLQVSKLTRAKLFNQFQPRPLSPHMRSSSCSLLFVPHDPVATSPVPLRRKRSAKVQKLDRDRRDRQLLAHADSPSLLSLLDDDLAPPPALFRNHSKRLSLLLASVSSLLLLIASDLYSSAFLSSDSLHEALSTPTAETSDLSDHSSPAKAYTFPTKPPPQPKAKPRLSRINSRAANAHHLALSSLTLSSPLTASYPFTATSPLTTASPLTTPNSHPFVDAINESPFEFSLNVKHQRERSRALSSLNGHLPFASLDIHEVEEESD